MAISSLSKFTVPLDGTGQSAASQGLLMPKLKYRYRVVFIGFGAGNDTHEMTKQVMTAGRPGVQFENVELAVYNSKINYAGRYTWADVQLVLRDDMTNAVSKLVGQQIQKQFDFFEQSSASSGSDYKFQTNIEILDGGNGAYTPVVIERFELYGCYLQNTVYQQADYKSSEPMDITLTLKYDNALQTDAAGNNVGIGSAVGRTLANLALGA
jgi:hypothetical protein